MAGVGGASGGGAGEPQAGSGSLPSGTGGAMAAAGNGGIAGTTPSCVPGTEGCACNTGACDAELACAEGTCRRVVCGDGTQDPGEECDDGNASDTDACTSGCVSARCGDGHVRGDTEQCDDGNDEDGDSCTNACAKRYNVAFVTSTTHNVMSLGGVPGGDAVCAARAEAAGLPGEFVAFMNTSAESIAARLEGARGWVRTDGKPFLDEIEGQATFYPPSLNEHGVAVSDWPPALGGYPSGASDNECEDWTSEGGDALFLIGDPTGGTGAWNGSWSGTQCSTPFRIYCLQRDYSSALTIEPAEGRLAFLSNAPWLPAGGLSAADARCNQDAVDAGLTGTFKALLATSTASAASRFSTEGTWVRRDGIPIVARAQDLFDPEGVLLAPLQVTAFGGYLGNYGGWSGGADPTRAGTATCDDWTSSSASALGTSGRVFFGTISRMLGYDDGDPCDAQYTHLYCLEDP